MKYKIKNLIRNKLFELIDYYFYVRENELFGMFKATGQNCKISTNSFYGQPEEIEIGNNVVINDYCHFWGLGGIKIGDNTMIASHCAITTVSHEKHHHSDQQKDTIQPISIGNNVWIGAHVVILPGIIIGDNSIVGAGSVVTKNIEPNSVYYGVPAKKQN